jgi:hypothetical protein
VNRSDKRQGRETVGVDRQGAIRRRHRWKGRGAGGAFTAQQQSDEKYPKRMSWRMQMDGFRVNKAPPARHERMSQQQWVIRVGRWGPSGGDRARKMPAHGIRNNRPRPIERTQAGAVLIRGLNASQRCKLSHQWPPWSPAAVPGRQSRPNIRPSQSLPCPSSRGGEHRCVRVRYMMHSIIMIHVLKASAHGSLILRVDMRQSSFSQDGGLE